MEKDAVNAIAAHVLKDGNNLLVLPFEGFSLFLFTQSNLFLKSKKLLFGVNVPYFWISCSVYRIF